MSKLKKVISHKNIARRLPVHITITLLLVAKIYENTGWVLSVVATIIALLWISFFISCVKDEEVQTDVFTGQPEAIE